MSEAAGVVGATDLNRETFPRWWLGDNQVGTAFFNALSIIFPPTERFFIDSVKPYLQAAEPALQAEIDLFVRQETAHSSAHVALNSQINATGYDTISLELPLRRRLIGGRLAPSEIRIGITAAMEHFTTIISRELLKDPTHLAGAPDAVRRIWLWHAKEEIQHKAVAFEVFNLATRSLAPIARFRLRTKLMRQAALLFGESLRNGMIELLQQDGMTRSQAGRACQSFLHGRRGILRRTLPALLSYGLPGFHPVWHDDTRLLSGGYINRPTF